MKKENLQTAIEATKAKLHNAEGERTGATPEELVMIDKKIRGLQIELKYLTESIEKLELLQDMIKGHTLVFPEMEQFTKDLNCYIEAGTEAVEKATTTIREADEEIEKLTAALEVAKAEGAVEKIIELSELLEDAKKKRECWTRLVGMTAAMDINFLHM